MLSVLPAILPRSRGGRYVDELHLEGVLPLVAVSKIDLRHLLDNTDAARFHQKRMFFYRGRRK